jgi:hypothetical protein
MLHLLRQAVLLLALCIIGRGTAGIAQPSDPDEPASPAPFLAVEPELTPSMPAAVPSVEPAAESPPPSEAGQRRGWGVQVSPLANFDTDQGVGFGGRVMLIHHGEHHGAGKPYDLAIMAQFFQTTRQVIAHRLWLDIPEAFRSKWRLEIDLAYRGDRFSPYYGQGNDSTYEPLFERCVDRATLEQSPDTCPDNPSFLGLRYYQFERRALPRLTLTGRRSLTGPLQSFLMYRMDLSTLQVTYPNDLGQHRDSKLVEDAKAGLLVGYDGETKEPFTLRTGEFTAGLAYDSRDIEPAPTTGMFHELSLRYGGPAAGGQFNYWGVNATLRFYQHLLPNYPKLVGAARLLIDFMDGDVPFHMLPSYGGLARGEGLGGLVSARGILKNRYQGKEKLILNAELRWTPLELQLLGQQFDFTLVSGIDGGRVWRDLSFRDGGGLHTSAVAGLRIAWNQFFIIRADYGASLTESSQGVYIDFDHSF